MPKAYAIGGQLIAMSKISCPPIDDIRLNAFENPDSEAFFRKLKEKHKFSDNDVVSAFQELARRIPVTEDHIVLAGYKNGKFLFLPLLDIG